MRLTLRLVVRAHDAERHLHRVPAGQHRRNDGVHGALGRAVGVGVVGVMDAQAAARVVEADPRDVAGTRELVEGCEGITFENEWVNLVLVTCYVNTVKTRTITHFT